MGHSTLYIPQDSVALALGADEIARSLQETIQSHPSVQIVRNSSRGLFWLEPLLEVETPQGRVGYGSVTEADLPSLIAAGLLEGKAGHPLYVGLVEEIPYLKRQTRYTFSRAGLADPLSLEAYCAADGFTALTQFLPTKGAEIIAQITQSGLRGRGGAAFPTGIKWQTVAQTTAAQKHIVCNADEGDSGTFSDRMVLEGDPYQLIEGMLLAGLAVGATKGWVYIRSEYPKALANMQYAIDQCYQAGWLGKSVANSSFHFDLVVRQGAGAYVCGEETALLESLEGRPGIVRHKPPLPAIEGLFGQPTVINNVITFASVPRILRDGAQNYQALGLHRSLGTLPFQLTGNIRFGGLVEIPFGHTLRELLFDFGGGTRSGLPIKAVQVGGPLGAYIPESQWDTPLDYEAYAKMGAILGHGGIVVHDSQANLAQLAHYAMEFCAIESCGKCTPCRIGSTRGVEIMEDILARKNNRENTELLQDLCHTMTAASLCALGNMTPYPVLSALKYYPQDFGIQGESV